MSSPKSTTAEKDERAADARPSEEPASTEATKTREQSEENGDASSGSPESSASEPGEVDESDASTPREVTEDESKKEPGETKDSGSGADAAPPLPNEPVPGQQQEQQDDGWEYHWNANTNSYWFYNRLTGVWQQENPRLQPTGAAAVATAVATVETSSASAPLPPGGAPPISAPGTVAGGYNPAIHGDYDPNAWYAQASRAAEEAAEEAAAAAARDPAGEYASSGFFNRVTGAWQREDQGASRHTDEAKSRRQLNAFFDVDAAANSHDGRSLKAERAGKKPSKAELKAFKEKRRAKKEEKRRAWLRD